MKREVLASVVAIAAIAGVVAFLEISAHALGPATGPSPGGRRSTATVIPMTNPAKKADSRTVTEPAGSPTKPLPVVSRVGPGSLAKGSAAVPAVAPSPHAQGADTKPPLTAVAAPADPPSILSVSLNPAVASPGQIVSGTVVTSSNVASVEARIGGYAASLAKVGVGQFHLNYSVPNLPPILRRTYSIEVIARNARGDETTAQTSISIR